jgi:predicted Zn-dependent peptidase
MRFRQAPACILLAAGSAIAAPPPGFVSETLPNGLSVSVLPDTRMPVVATQVWFRVGSANEEPKTRGFAHLFEHLMFGGTPSHPERAVWDLHERYGGDVNAFTSFDETVYVSEIPPAGHAEVLAIEADRMAHLDFTEDNLANEKRIVTEELRVSTENDPFSRLFTKALGEILGSHPYSLTPVGTKEDISAATLEHAREFYEAWYRPVNAHVVVVGPVDPEETLAAIRREFCPLPGGGAPPADVPAIPDWPLPERVALEEDIPPVEVAVLGFPLPPPSHPDAVALRVAAEILAWGSVDVFQDEIVRVRGKALEAGTEVAWARRGGVLAFYAANLPYRREKTAFRHIEEVRSHLGTFAWLVPERLAAAKRSLRAEEFRRSYHASATADAIGRAGWWEGDAMRAFEAAGRIDAVGEEEVRRVVRHWILDARPVRVYVRPEKVPLYVTLFGWLYPLFGGR